MKKAWILFLAAVLALSAAAGTFAEEPDNGTVMCRVENGTYVIRIPVRENDRRWVADELVGDDSVIRLVSAEYEDGYYIVRYAALGDGEATVIVRHYLTPIACDQAQTWDLVVRDGAVQECTGGSYTASPSAAEMEAFVCGGWHEADTQFTQLTLARRDDQGFRLEIVSPVSHEAYLFRAAVYYDCWEEAFRYEDGTLYDLPILEGDDVEPAVSGLSGSLLLEEEEGKLLLRWISSENPEEEIVFVRENEAKRIDFSESSLYDITELQAAAALVTEHFAGFEGCTMTSLRYAGDDACSEENLRWLNSLKDGRHFTQCAEFLMSFISDGTNPVLEKAGEYLDYQWWLAREDGGDWELITWGYQ